MNKYEKARDYLKATGEVFKLTMAPEMKLAQAAAIEALEKQIPQKWIAEDMGDGETIWKCPCCNEYWALMEGTPKDNEYTHCPQCGQALEMEE
mgnify:CR=1 FL=1